MNIIFYHPFFDSELWINGMKKHLPQADIRAIKALNRKQ